MLSWMAQGPQPQYTALVADVSGSGANLFCSRAPQCGAQRLPKLGEFHVEYKEMPGALSSHQLSGPAGPEARVARPHTCRRRPWGVLVTRSIASRMDREVGAVSRTWCGSLGSSWHRRDAWRALISRQLHQGAAVSPRQKHWESELWWGHTATLVPAGAAPSSDARMDGKSEQPCGGAPTHKNSSTHCQRLRSIRGCERQTAGISPCLPWEGPDRLTVCTMWSIPCPLTAWLNTWVKGLGAVVTMLADAAGASPLRLLHLKGGPIIGRRLCKWNWAMMRTMVPAVWSCPCSYLMTHVKTASIKKESSFFLYVTVIGDSAKRNRRNSLDLLLREVCASLVCVLKMRKENFLSWNGPHVISHYGFFKWVVMKRQQECQGQSREPSGLWDN